MSDPIIAVNSHDRQWTRHRYILWFGAYGWTRLMVWANSVSDALDEAADWMEANAPGLLDDSTVMEAYNDLRFDGDQAKLPFESDEDLWNEATQDMTPVGDSHYIASWEWGVDAIDPTRLQIKRLLAA